MTVYQNRLLITALLACALLMAGCQPSTQAAEPGPAVEQAGESSAASSEEGGLENRESEEGEPVSSFDCTDSNPHPIGQNIAETYISTSYVEVMTWFCAGYSFENILIALETSEAVNVPAETLLEMLLEKSWEEIWVEVGFTGN